VKPGEKMVRLWCRAYAAEIDFSADYQPYVVANFSGILVLAAGLHEDGITVFGDAV
jgi:hypothetical protein